ncbi:hypothetical protein ACFS2C_21135 [Prauserella oleivorans]|uniref:Uncharacterized protein n=1 Tax=Prauserella oleivorans TaxID=1478153 RepID=A0ABW5WHP0_9PSEU
MSSSDGCSPTTWSTSSICSPIRRGGPGHALFPTTGPDIALELLTSRSTSRGITIQTYRPAGRPDYATSTAGAHT